VTAANLPTADQQLYGDTDQGAFLRYSVGAGQDTDYWVRLTVNNTVSSPTSYTLNFGLDI
jgi:hypothetical protein